MLINLWVRDKSNGYIHQVGTDVHDSIEFLCGQVIYCNMQSTASTLDDYEWVEAPDLDDYVSVTPEQLWFDRELVHKNIQKAIQMIDEYLLEPNSIHKDWVEALQLCRKALIEKQEEMVGER